VAWSTLTSRRSVLFSPVPVDNSVPSIFLCIYSLSDRDYKTSTYRSPILCTPLYFSLWHVMWH
jgi:hypothetical protein